MKRARIPNRLTALQVSRVKVPGMYPDGLGLYLHVGQATTKPATVKKSWIFRYKMPGMKVSREMGLGALHEVSLQQARAKSQEARALKAAGTDPLEAKAAQKAATAAERAKTVTFQEASERYIEAHKSAWKNEKHRDQWGATLKTYAYPVMGSVSIHNVDADLMVKVLEPIWTTKTETASRLRGRIERILDWATVRGYRSGDNPARWRGQLQSQLPPPNKLQRTKHHPALPYTKIGGFMVDLAKDKTDAADALTLLILTATRTNEVTGAKWPEIDFRTKVWTIPPERIKAGREHRIPLSVPAIALLKRRHKNRADDGFIFPGRAQAHMSNGAILMLLERMGKGNITGHGFRSTFRDWAAEQTNFPRDVAEMALAHAIGDKVEAAYRRGDLFAKRTKMMDAWAVYAAAGATNGRTGAKVR